MMTSIRADGKQIIARDSQKNEGPFSCPECEEETILKKCRVKVDHFAHKPPVFCSYGQGESELHRECKIKIFDNLIQHEEVKNCQLEKKLGKVIPDIYFELGEIPIAIEVQISNLSMSKIIERTEEYNRLGIYVLWLAISSWEIDEERYAPKQWEKWLHATYYGRVYYWVEALNVVAIHFDDYELWVELTEWGGGYGYNSKRYRTPNHGSVVNILSDFKPTKRLGWKGGNIYVPNCHILTDKQPVWWK